jgi:hypothetical protein
MQRNMALISDKSSAKHTTDRGSKSPLSVDSFTNLKPQANKRGCHMVIEENDDCDSSTAKHATDRGSQESPPSVAYLKPQVNKGCHHIVVEESDDYEEVEDEMADEKDHGTYFDMSAFALLGL